MYKLLYKMKEPNLQWPIETLIKNRLILFDDLRRAEKTGDEKEQKMIRTEIESINEMIAEEIICRRATQ